MSGKKLSELQKLKNFASKLKREIDSLSKKTELDLFEGRFNFYENTENDFFGRPPVKLKTQIARKLKKLEQTMSEIRDLEEQQGVAASTEQDVFGIQKSKVGRKKVVGEIDVLKKYIRRQEKDIRILEEEISQGLDNEEVEQKSLGRHKISRAEKVAECKKRIAKAQQKISEIEQELPAHAVVMSEIVELKALKRQMRVFVNTPDHFQNKNLIGKITQEEALEKMEAAEDRIQVLTVEYNRLFEEFQKQNPVKIEKKDNVVQQDFDLGLNISLSLSTNSFLRENFSNVNFYAFSEEERLVLQNFEESEKRDLERFLARRKDFAEFVKQTTETKNAEVLLRKMEKENEERKLKKMEMMKKLAAEISQEQEDLFVEQNRKEAV